MPLATPYGPPSAPVASVASREPRWRSCRATATSTTLPAPPHQLPREHLGDARGGGAAHHRPVRLRLAEARAQPGTFVICDQFVDRTHGAREHLLRRAADDPRLRGRSLLPGSAATCWRRAPRSWASRSWTAGRWSSIQGPRFSTRAESRWFSAERLRRGQHDPVPGVLARPRARALLRERLAGHRLRRRPGGHAGRRAGVRRRGVRACSPRTWSDCGRCSFRAVPRIGPQPEDACATALSSAIVR